MKKVAICYKNQDYLSSNENKILTITSEAKLYLIIIPSTPSLLPKYNSYFFSIGNPLTAVTIGFYAPKTLWVIVNYYELITKPTNVVGKNKKLKYFITISDIL